MFLGRSSWLIVFGVLVTSAFTIPSFSQSAPRPTAPARPGFIDIPYSYGGHDFVLKSINGSVRMIYEHGGPVGVVGMNGQITAMNGGDAATMTEAMAAYQNGPSSTPSANDVAAPSAQPANSGVVPQIPTVTFSSSGEAIVQDKNLGPVKISPDGTVISFTSSGSLMTQASTITMEFKGNKTGENKTARKTGKFLKSAIVPIISGGHGGHFQLGDENWELSSNDPARGKRVLFVTQTSTGDIAMQQKYMASKSYAMDVSRKVLADLEAAQDAASKSQTAFAVNGPALESLQAFIKTGK